MTGEITLERWVELTSTTPARMFGLYGRKGVIQPGADGDIVREKFTELAATDTEVGSVAAFVHPGGLRADLDAGPVLGDEARAVLPFNNYLTTVDLTGAQ